MNKLNLKKYYISKIILFSIFIFVIYISYKFIISKNIAESATNKYLQSLNINIDEIELIEIHYSFKRSPSGYNINIIYKNEPNLRYRYRYIIKNNKFFLDNIYNDNTAIALYKIEEIKKPLHEKYTNIELLFLEEYNTLEKDSSMKYTFFDYIKDYIDIHTKKVYYNNAKRDQISND